MRKLEILLLIAGIAILASVIWREQQLRDWKDDPTRVVSRARMLAPRFTLTDHNRKVVKLERLLGRHRVVLVFFDARLGIDQDPRTKMLLENFTKIDQTGIEIIAVGTATPFANEEAEKRLGMELPFPVLSDIDINNPAPTPAHRMYGQIDSETESPIPGLFLIDRDGSVAVGLDGRPEPVANERPILSKLANGKWPL